MNRTLRRSCEGVLELAIRDRPGLSSNRKNAHDIGPGVSKLPVARELAIMDMHRHKEVPRRRAQRIE